MTNLQLIMRKLIDDCGTQQKLADRLGISANYVSMMNTGKRPISVEIAEKLESEFGINSKEILKTQAEERLRSKYDSDDFFSHLPLPEQKLDNLDKLGEIIARKNGTADPSSKVVNEDDLVESIEIKVPVAGQAGLESKMYPEEMVDNLETYKIKVKPSERGIFYLIEVAGESMTPLILPGDWLRCEEISKLRWFEDKFFKENKIYCIWHNTRGILFKRIVYRQGELWCSSDNKDKKMFPDFPLDIHNCTKMLKVVEIAKRKI
ncbi:helix-turn-helix domain-containing protein [Cruoricaptor ignavus]|uniref:helix-turn-helix domain-containing protein n=1 Tax=Cruoricaptor ignavus TaxID=1118202 RepID=UPI00370D2E12